MAIRMVPDVAAPLSVVAIDLVAESMVPQYAEYADYVMTAGGYLAAFLNKGGDFIKTIGVASLPLTARKIYDRVRAPAAVTRARQTVRTPVQRSYQPEFSTKGSQAF